MAENQTKLTKAQVESIKLEVIEQIKNEKRRKEETARLKKEAAQVEKDLKAEKEAQLKEQFYRKEAKAYEDSIKHLTPDQQLLIGQNMRAAVGAQDITDPSDIIATVSRYIVNQMVITKKISYGITKIQNLRVIPQAGENIYYTDFREGNSLLTSDGGSTTADKAFTDMVIDNWNGEYNELFLEVKKTDFYFSLKYKLPANFLNDIAKNDGIFAAMLKDFTNLTENQMQTFWTQRTLKFLDETTVDKNYDIPNGTFESDQVETTQQALSKINVQLKIAIRNLLTPSRKHRKSDDASKHPEGADRNLMYQLKPNKKLYLLITPDAQSYFETYLKSGTFQLKELALPEQVEIIPVNFNAMTEEDAIYTWKNNTDYERLKMMLIDSVTYQEIVFYEAERPAIGPKGYTVTTKFIKAGQYERKDGLIYTWTEKAPELLESNTM